jgi:hypothetical protein
MSRGKLITPGGCIESTKVLTGIQYSRELMYKGRSNHESFTGSYRIHGSSPRRVHEKSHGLTNEILRRTQDGLCEGSAIHLVILRATKDLGPAQPSHGSARCFALLSMTIMLACIPPGLFCHPQTLNGPHQDSSVQNEEAVGLEP